MADTNNAHKRGLNLLRGALFGGRFKTAAAVSPGRLLEFSSGNVQHSSANSYAVAGVSKDYCASGQYMDVLMGAVPVACESPVVAGQALKAAASGKVMPLLTADLAGDTLDTSSVGIAFTNQPANDGIEIVSADAADTTQSITLYGTTTGTDTVVVETVALNGTTAVSSVKTDWGVLLGYTLSASCAGTVTVREASGNATISTITTGLTSKGLDAVTAATYAYNVAPTVEGDGASTKQIGLIGTNSAGTTIYDSQALSGTTAQTMNSAFNTITYFLTGDVENTVSVVLKLGAAEAEVKKVGRALETQATAGDDVLAFIIP